jgi:hypothetical protein
MENLEWLNLNERRGYPFHEGTDRTPYVDADLTVSSGIPISNSLFVDFKAVMVGSTYMQLYLSKLTVANGVVSVTLSGFIPGNPFTVASIKTQVDGGLTTYEIFDGTATLSSDYSVMILTPRSLYSTNAARLVLGRRDNFLTDGIYYFRPDQTLFEPCLVEAGSNAVTQIQVKSAEGDLVALSGVVDLVAGENIAFTVDIANNAILISAIPGEGYISGCDTTGKSVVKTVNGIALEHLKIESGNDCIDVAYSGSTVTIKDLCSTPCCGCEELKVITQQLIELASRIDNVEEYRTLLESALTSLQHAVTSLPTPV